MAVPFVFNRPDLAKRMAEIALGTDPLNGSSDLFLAAPRRTGKSRSSRLTSCPNCAGAG